MLLTIFIAAGLLGQQPVESAAGWRAQFESGKQSYAKRSYADATARLTVAADAAAAEGNPAGVLESLRLLAAVHRATGDYAQAEQALTKAAAKCGEPESAATAAILDEIAAVQRAQGRDVEALATIEKAIRIREAHPEWPRVDLARGVTTAALLRYKAGESDKAVEGLERAVREWDLAAPGDPQALPALEALATAYRDRSRYADAEPLLQRALRVHEAAAGPEGAEVIAMVDSLAYIEFGLKKFPEAEALYRRLLALWEKNGGPDHPMTALTLDKMAEFFAFQQRYEEAEKCATAALAARTKLHVASLNQTGRILLMEAKLAEAEDLYGRTVKIGDLAHAPDESLDPVLRIYAKILRELKRDADAQALEARAKDALLRKADREGRRPSPVK
jgi:tetratricopeptide (TPR) repeat protein